MAKSKKTSKKSVRGSSKHSLRTHGSHRAKINNSIAKHTTAHITTSPTHPSHHKKRSKIIAYLELARAGNCLIAGIAILIGFFIAGGYSQITVLTAIVSGMLVCAGGQAINDYFDYKIDARHSPKRPIPSGRVGRHEAIVFAMIMMILGVGLGKFVNELSFAIACIFAILLIAYPLFMNKVKYIGNIVVALGTAVTFIYGAAASGTVIPLIVVLAAGAFLANLGREVTKDIEDLKKDEGVKKTRPMMIGINNSKRAVATYYALAIVVGVWAFINFKLNPAYLLFTLIGSAILIYASMKLYSSSAVESQKISKYAMVVTLIAFIAAGF